MTRDDPLKHPRAELRAAERALEAMKQAKDFATFDEEWRAFLAAIEKVWIKTERCCQHVRKDFQPWQGQYHTLRRKDMLLRYLKQARDADNHSVQEVANYTPGGLGLRFAGGSGHIQRLTIHNGIVTYEGSPNLVVDHHPPRLEAVRVKNNGEWYNPPSSHLDKPVTDHHPAHLAQMGLAFYKEFVDEVERKFFESIS